MTRRSIGFAGMAVLVVEGFRRYVRRLKSENPSKAADIDRYIEQMRDGPNYEGDLADMAKDLRNQFGDAG